MIALSQSARCVLRFSCALMGLWRLMKRCAGALCKQRAVLWCHSVLVLLAVGLLCAPCEAQPVMVSPSSFRSTAAGMGAGVLLRRDALARPRVLGKERHAFVKTRVRGGLLGVLHQPIRCEGAGLLSGVVGLPTESLLFLIAVVGNSVSLGLKKGRFGWGITGMVLGSLTITASVIFGLLDGPISCGAFFHHIPSMVLGFSAVAMGLFTFFIERNPRLAGILGIVLGGVTMAAGVAALWSGFLGVVMAPFAIAMGAAILGLGIAALGPWVKKQALRQPVSFVPWGGVSPQGDLIAGMAVMGRF